MPHPAKTLCKGPELRTVAWNRMVLVITRNNLLQPRTNGGDRLMHACTQFCPDQAQFCLHPLFRRFPPDDEGGGRSGPAAVMCEAEKCERLWLPFTPLLSVLNGMPPKFDEPCLFRVKFQTELGEPLSELIQEPLGFRPVFEAHYQIVRITDDHHFAR